MSHQKKNSKAYKTKHKHQTPITNKYLREDPDFAKRTVVVNDSKKFELSSDSEEEAPDFDYLLKLPPSTGSHFLLKSEQEKFVDASAQFSKHFVIDTNLLNLAIKSIPFNERHDIKNVEWSSAEIMQMQEEAKVNEKIYQEALEKIQLEEKQKPVKKLEKKVENLKVTKQPKAQTSATSTSIPEIQDWLDDILDM